MWGRSLPEKAEVMERGSLMGEEEDEPAFSPAVPSSDRGSSTTLTAERPVCCEILLGRARLLDDPPKRAALKMPRETPPKFAHEPAPKALVKRRRESALRRPR